MAFIISLPQINGSTPPSQGTNVFSQDPTLNFKLCQHHLRPNGDQVAVRWEDSLEKLRETIQKIPSKILMRDFEDDTYRIIPYHCYGEVAVRSKFITSL